MRVTATTTASFVGELLPDQPVLHGAHPDARLIGVKAGQPSGVGSKATSGVVATQRRTRTPMACSICGRPAGAVVPGGLRRGERLICRRCVQEAAEITTTATDADTSVLSADDLIDAYRLTDPELTSEREYAEALDAEIRYQLEPDGTITRATDDPTRGRAWGRP